MKLLTSLAVAVAVLIAAASCGGGSPTAPSSSGSPVNIVGTYDLTLTASSSCSTLATAAKSQTWTAAITQSGATANLSIQTNIPGGSNGFGLISGSSVNFTTVFISETLGGSLYEFSGSLNGTASGSTISGTANGGITFSTACTAADHQFTLKLK